MLAAFLDSVRNGDLIEPKRMAERLRVPMTGLATMTSLNRNTLASKASSLAVQSKLGEIARIISRAADLCGDEGRAIIWFKHQPLTGWSGKTAEQLVSEGNASGVMWHLDGLENGVFA